MNDRLVSPEETSALMDPVSEPASGEFSFARPPAFLGEREKLFDEAIERIALQLSRRFSRLLRRKAEFSWTGREERVPPPATSKAVVFRLGDADDAVQVVLNEDLVPPAADLLLGADEPGDDRALTPLERRVLTPVAMAVRDALETEGLVCGEPDLAAPQPATDEPRSVILLQGSVEFDERKGTLSVALPPLRARRLVALDDDSAAPARGVGLHRVAALPVRLEVVLAGGTLRLGEIRSLVPGDVVRLDQSEQKAVPVLINGVRAARARLGARGGRRAAVMETRVAAAELNGRNRR